MVLDVGLERETPRLKNVDRPRHDNAKSYRNLSSRYCDSKIFNGDFLELNLSSSSIPQRKSMPCRPLEVKMEDDNVHKRGSMYHSSSEVRRLRKYRAGMSSLGSAKNDNTFLSFDIVDSASQLRRDGSIHLQEDRSSLISLNKEELSSISGNNCSVPYRPTEFLDLSFRHLPEETLSVADSPVEIGTFPSDSICLHPEATAECLPKDATTLHENLRRRLPKSFSAKVGIFDSPCDAERSFPKTNTKAHFSPLKKVLDPIMKSKSLRTAPSTETETDGCSSTRKAFQKSLLNDFRDAIQEAGPDEDANEKVRSCFTPASPAHIHGILKLEFKHGVPSFEFVVKDREDALWAKTWKTDNEVKWVYTFHSYKRKSNNNGRVAQDRLKQSSRIIGQMHVSCYLCSQVTETGSFSNSMVTEFILYDIAAARRNIGIKEGPNRSFESSKSCKTDVAEISCTSTFAEGNRSLEPEKYPWPPVDLHPHLEVAAVLIQIPFERSKEKTVEDIMDIRHSHLSSITFDQGRSALISSNSNASVKVITPSGNHGMPNTEDGGPSSLLDRWRYGGGCDCGGWDMACPLFVFDNPCHEDATDCTTSRSHVPKVLYVQGRKEKIPALTITASDKGDYLVEFHAQLSALQAFSICIAVLHSSEASSVVSHEKSRPSLYSRSLKLLLEEELRNLIEAVANEEKRKANKKEKIPLVFLLDPPFSPMGRV